MSLRTIGFSAPLLVLALAANAQTLVVQARQLLDRPERAPRGAATLLIREGKIEQVRDGHLGADAFERAHGGSEL